MTLTTVNAGMLDTQAQYNGFKSRIINGAMVIDQRNAGASVVAPTAGGYTLDRWFAEENTDGAATIQQISDAPTGFSNSLRFTVTTADASLGATQGCEILQNIEGFNTFDLAFGTASASTITLSFWVKSSLTGTFGGALRNSAYSRSYPYTYTISSANTWEYKTVTIAGDTSGTWIGATNGVGLRVGFGLGIGSTFSGTAGAWAGSNFASATGATNVMGTLSATWQVTGVQLEKGSTATSFDYRPYGTELQLCQRYAYPIRGGFSGFGNGTTVVDTGFNFPVEMRTAPSLTQGTLVYIAYGAGSSFVQSASSTSLPNNITQNGCILRFNNFTLTANSAYVLAPNATTTAVTTYAGILTAEL